MKKGFSVKIALLVLMVVSLCGILYYGNKKEGYHVDELYSYGLANSEYLPFMHFGEMEYSVKDWMLEYGAGENVVNLVRNLLKSAQILVNAGKNWRSTNLYQDYLRAQANSADTHTTTWVSGSAYQDYLSPSKTNRFNYASVYYNQRGDVHPPLFYLALHTVCSFFPGVFSKWFGLLLNAAYVLLALWVLFRMVSKHLGGEKVALLVVAVYGLSGGFVSTAIFIRMYALLTLMMLWCLDVHLDLAKNEYVITKKLGRRLVPSILLGYLTHYYFVLFVLTLAMIMTIRMLLRKKWKCALQYVITTALTGVLGILVWPFSIRHVFGGYRGQSSIAALKQNGFNLFRTRFMGGFVLDDLFGGWRWVAVLLLIIMVVAIGWLCVKNAKGFLGEMPWGKTAMLLFPAMLYGWAVTQSAPFLDKRYVLSLYPFCFLLMICGLWWLAGKVNVTGKERYVVVAICLGMLLLNNSMRCQPSSLAPGEQETTEVPENCVCVYVLPDGSWNASANETNVLAKCKQVAVVYASNLEQLKDTYHYQSGETLMVAVEANLDADEMLEKVREVFGVEDLVETARKENSGSRKIYLSQP